MLSLILTILKIIGIVLAAVIGLAILIVCIILFVPVRYRATGYYKGDYGIKGRITWLLHFISVGIIYDNDNPLKIVVKILGIPVFNNLRSHTKTRKKKRNNDNADTDPIEAKNDTEEPEPYSHPEIKISSIEDDSVLDKSGTNGETLDIVTGSGIEHDDFYKEKKIKKGILDRIVSFIRKIIQFVNDIKYTFLHICDIIKNIKSNITYYCNVLQKEETKLAWQACKKQLLSIWHNLKPKKFNINLHIGMEDPANMGQILGVWGMFYPLHEGRIAIEPEFDHYVFEGDFDIQGRITVYVYLWAAYTVLYNKNIKYFRKCLSREKSMEGNKK